MPTRLVDSIVIEAPAEVAWAFVSDPHGSTPIDRIQPSDY